MPGDLYDDDILIWSERQSALMRQLAAGERPNEALDWDNLIEEIESVGRSELQSCESLIVQALNHLDKARRWPANPSVNHWRSEIVGFLADAQRRFTPSMRQKIDLPSLYAEAQHRVEALGAEYGMPLRSPDLCPFRLDDLIGTRPDVQRLLTKLGRAA